MSGRKEYRVRRTSRARLPTKVHEILGAFPENFPNLPDRESLAVQRTFANGSLPSMLSLGAIGTFTGGIIYDYEAYLTIKQKVERREPLTQIRKGPSRPSPSESATKFDVGYSAHGNDGNMYTVQAAKNGVKRWVQAKNNPNTVAAPSSTQKSQPHMSARTIIGLSPETIRASSPMRMPLPATPSDLSKLGKSDLVALLERYGDFWAAWLRKASMLPEAPEFTTYAPGTLKKLVQLVSDPFAQDGWHLESIPGFSSEINLLWYEEFFRRWNKITK